MIIALNNTNANSEKSAFVTSVLDNGYIPIFKVDSNAANYAGISGYIQCPAVQNVGINIPFAFESYPALNENPALNEMFPIRMMGDASQQLMRLDVTIPQTLTVSARLVRQGMRLIAGGLGARVLLATNAASDSPVTDKSGSLRIVAAIPEFPQQYPRALWSPQDSILEYVDLTVKSLLWDDPCHI